MSDKKTSKKATKKVEVKAPAKKIKANDIVGGRPDDRNPPQRK